MIVRTPSKITKKDRDYPVVGKHSKITACAMPPGLPAAARQTVIKHFEDILTTYLEDVAARRKESHETQETDVMSPALEERRMSFIVTPLIQVQPRAITRRSNSEQ